MSKKNVILIYGGNSKEHEISIRSAHNIAKATNTSLFNMKYVYSIWNSFLNGDNSVHWLQIWNLVVFGKWYSINDINKTK